MKTLLSLKPMTKTNEHNTKLINNKKLKLAHYKSHPQGWLYFFTLKHYTYITNTISTELLTTYIYSYIYLHKFLYPPYIFTPIPISICIG